VNPIGPRACYDEGKRCAETLFFDYFRQFKMPIKVARIFNTYGPRMHPHDGRVVSNFITQALKNEPLTIYGDGDQTRSFCYVSDMVDGLVRLMKSPESFTGPVNLGNPVEFTIRELAEKVIALTGSRSKIESMPLPPDDPRQRQPDIALAKRELGWQPKVQLDEGLAKTIQVLRRNAVRVAGTPGMKPVLVTGAAGYVGSHTCKVLAQSGFEPIGLDSLERAGVRQLPWGPIAVVETADTSAVARVLARYRPVAALHFAAYAYVGESAAQPAMYYRNNFGGSLGLFEALRTAGIGNWVFSSSCATYGVPDVLPIAEGHPQRPVNPYGTSKLMVERMLLDCDLAHGVRSVALRYFNAAGRRPGLRSRRMPRAGNACHSARDPHRAGGAGSL
jgi:nucleoside-diphosphate-sugar epimerase